MNTVKKIDRKHIEYDVWLILIVASLTSIGLLMVTSASMVISDRLYDTPFYFFYHQLIYIFLSVVVGFFVVRIPLSFWEKIGPFLLVLTLLLLVAVLVPGIGREVNGSSRWIGFGSLSIQVSELAKFASIVYLSGYLIRHKMKITTFSGFIKPMILFGFVAILLLLEPDFGATTVIIVTVLGMLFFSGARLWQFLLLIILVGGVMALLAVTSPYRMARLTAFLNPWAHQFGSGYQLTQSLIAFGRGGFFGVGLGNSVQKLFYLPEAHTDFLFAVLAEELGIFGQFIVIGLFLALIFKIFSIVKRSFEKNRFASYMACGIALWFSLQTIISIGVNIGLLPTKGLTLPFISYGGSSILLNFVAVAILLRIHHETYE